MVRVLVTTDTFSGVWTHARELVSGLVTHGAQVTLVSFGEIPLPDQTAWMQGLHGLEYHPTAFRLDWMQEGEQDFYAAQEYLCEFEDSVSGVFDRELVDRAITDEVTPLVIR